MSKDKDIARGIADIDINNDGDAPTVGRSLKYMEQLVRVPAFSPFPQPSRPDVVHDARTAGHIHLRAPAFGGFVINPNSRDFSLLHARVYVYLPSGVADHGRWTLLYYIYRDQTCSSTCRAL